MPFSDTSRKKTRRKSIRRKSIRRSRKSRNYDPNKPIQGLRKGTLGKYGYSLNKNSVNRKKSLRKAVKKYGSGTVIKKLNAVCVLTKNRTPENSKKFCSDKRWVQKMYGNNSKSIKRSTRKSRRRR